MAQVPVTEKEFARYMERAAEFAKSHPDYTETLADAAKRGLNLSTAHTAEIVRLRAPEVAYSLAKRENESRARAMNVAEGEYVNPDRAADAICREHSRLQRNDTFRTIEEKPDEVATYLAKRAEDFKSGKRRRR